MRPPAPSLLIGLLLVGCGANFNSIYRADSMDYIQVRSVDAKQRLIFSTQRNDVVIVCPEPSPDALSAGGSGGDLSASQLGKIAGLSLGGASSESAGSLGLRTQTISLLRDQMTHLCLLRMSGNVTDKEYADTLRRVQVSALGMLAIEQLTGATKAPPIVVAVGAQRSSPAASGTGGSASSDGDKGASTSLTLITTGNATPSSSSASQPSREISQAVVDILKLILAEGFNTPACRTATARYEAIAASQATEEVLESAATRVVTMCSDLKETVATLSSKDLGQKLMNKAAELKPAETAAQAPAVSRIIEGLDPSGKPLEGYQIDVFVCDRDSANHLNDIRRLAGDVVQPKTTGRVRVQKLSDDAFKKRSNGLDPAKAPFAIVFYDTKDGGAEMRFATSLRDLVQRSLPSGPPVTLKENTGRSSTPYYLSSWVCLIK